MSKHRFTRKQVEILETIRKGAPDGDFLDMDMLLEMLPYETTKQSMQFSIRALIRRGLIEKKGTELRRGRNRIVYSVTPKAVESFDPDSGSFDVIIEGDLV